MRLLLVMMYYLLIQCVCSNPTLIYKKYSNAVVKVELVRDELIAYSGTGFFVGKKGVILTNHHVVKEFKNENYALRIRLKNGSTYDKVEIGQCSDQRKIDLCLLKIDFRPKSFVKNSRKKYVIGEQVYIIGHPLGLEWTISDGILSSERKISGGKVAKHETILTENYIDSIQVTAPISSGNSGGPIFDKKGRLLGIATWRLVQKNAQNLNFGVNSIEALSFYNEFQKSISETHRNRLTGLVPSILYIKIEEQIKQNSQKFKKKPIQKSEDHSSNQGGANSAILFHSNDRIKYKGAIEFGKPHGYGVLYDYLGRIKYKGNFSEGKYWGKGIKYRNEKKIQECTYVANECEGIGTSYFRGKKIYAGEFNQGVYHGLGVKFFEDSKYEGAFKDGKLVKGFKYSNDDELEYEGDFNGYLFEGQGIYYSKDGVFQYSGKFNQGYLTGKGEVRLFKTDDLVYRGYFKKSNFDGYGEFYAEGQLIYEGYFSKGYYHGSGTLYNEYGKLVHKGQFSLGKVFHR